MKPQPSGEAKRWALSREAFDRLLSAMDPDRDRAAYKYEAIRGKLLRFFEWQGVACSEDCADEALNVVARRLTEGEKVQSIDAYCSGVGRMVLLAYRRTYLKEASFQRSLAGDPGRGHDSSADQERNLRALEGCLGALPEESRDLILAYHCTEGRGLMANRKNLAVRLDLQPNALRIRAHRIRLELEHCVRRALERAGD